MQIQGIIVGIATFAIIGIFHPIVIKGEYHFGVKIWPVFCLCGIGFLILSIFISNITVSSILSVIAFTCFWSIPELFHQKKRVAKGWYPRKPKK